MISNTKKGYFTLEAAIFLPVFIIGVLTLGYCINIYCTAENITFSMLDETGRLAARAYDRKTAPLFSRQLEERLESENKNISNVKAVDFRYLYKDNGKEGQIVLGCQYTINLPAPLKLNRSVRMKSQIKCRGFIGQKEKGTSMSFDEMERNGNSEIVWIFPTWGEVFHNDICTYVKSNAAQMVLTPELKRRYNPCELCKPQTMPAGMYVYCFKNSGKAYHRESCRLVERYTIEIEKEDALSKGYRPCDKCGGG